MARARRLTDREQPSRHEGGGNFARPRNNRAGQGLARNKILKCALSVLRVGFQFIGLEALAILFRLQLPDAVDAGGIAFTNRLLYSEELRVAIDTLDARLVALLAVRQAYIERAAQLKTNRDQVRDPVRVEDVVAKVIAEGRRAGLSAEIAEPVWRTLIEASIRHEFEVFDKR